MIRGTVHDLVQWIVALEQENSQLKQLLTQLQAEIKKPNEESNGKVS